MTKRIKLTAPAIRTREEMERLMGDIAQLSITRDGLTVQMDEQITAIRSRFEADLAGIAEDLDAKLALARDWAEANPTEFGDRKSIQLTHGELGWRTGMPKLKTMAGWTWDRVLEWLKDNDCNYVRTKAEVDKAKLLADAELITEPGLRAMGIKVVQDESFFVDPKREPMADNRATA